MAGFRSRLAHRERMLGGMADVTQLLDAAAAGNPKAAAELLALVHDELRKLAAARMAEEKAGQTLQPTALVHEAYVRLVGGAQPQDWDGRGHFFAAAAEAMRRILVESARRKKTEKRGGASAAGTGRPPLRSRARSRPTSAVTKPSPGWPRTTRRRRTLKLRHYAGLSVEEAGTPLGLSRPTAYRLWAYARSWLRARSKRCAGGS